MIHNKPKTTQRYEFTVEWHFGGYVKETGSVVRVEEHIQDLLEMALDMMENNIIGDISIGVIRTDVWRQRSAPKTAPEIVPSFPPKIDMLP